MTTPERMDREGDTQPLPEPNDQAYVHDLMIGDIKNRRELGARRYGTPLQPFNGRDPLLDAYEEALDMAVYLKQALIEKAPTEWQGGYAWPPQYRIDQCSCQCGGSLAWMQRRETGAWEMIGCVCHNTPDGVQGVMLTVDV